jgi:hypothetical protein
MAVEQKTASGRQRQAQGDIFKVREKDIQRQVMQYLSYVPDLIPLFWRQNSGALQVDGRYIRLTWNWKGEPICGISDILGILWDGRFLAIEVKGPGGRLTKAQEFFLREVQKTGGVGIVVYSLEGVKDLISRLKKEKRDRS